VPRAISVVFKILPKMSFSGAFYADHSYRFIPNRGGHVGPEIAARPGNNKEGGRARRDLGS